MKINFFLPEVYKGIAGGFKVVYQYSNYLASKGHDVRIYYNLKNGENGKHIPKSIAYILKKIMFIGYPKWCKLHENVTQSAVKNYNEQYIRDANISIATSPYTAYSVYQLPKTKGEKFYFIQGYENWGKTTDDFVRKSYDLGMNNIVISHWLKEIVDKYSSKGDTLIPNGIDLDIFKVKNTIENRNPKSICMLYSTGETKGCNYGMDILKKLKQKYVNLKVNLFGSVKPKHLPKWMSFTKNATELQVAEILNDSAIFMCTSIEEGFGLPGLEAMACGCALATTNCLGIMEYANSKNSLISKPKDVKAMYKNIDKLLSDKELRIELAKKGNKDAQIWNLETSQEKFEKYLLENIDKEKNFRKK